MNTYEAQISSIFGADYHAFSFWKGRVALYAILRALDLKETDEVILPGYTCVVVPNAVRYAGAKPVYADIGMDHYNIDPTSVEKRISKYTRVLIVQHTYGIPADIWSLRDIAAKYGLYLIEDCAHVLLGSKIQGVPLGSFGKAAFFSFQWSKPYTTGLGGMVVTHDKELAERLTVIKATFQDPPLYRKQQLQIQYWLYRRFFKPKLYWFSQNSLHALSKFGLFVGSSSSKELTGREEPSDMRWTMSNFQQRTGLAQMSKLKENSDHRQLIAKYYSDALRMYSWPVNTEADSTNFKLLRFPVQVTNKDQVLQKAKHARVEIGSWFDTPLHPLPLSEHDLIGYQLGSCPIAETTCNNVINLPLHDRVDSAEAERVVNFLISEASPAAQRVTNKQFFLSHLLQGSQSRGSQAYQS